MYPIIGTPEKPKVYTFFDAETCALGHHHSINLPWQISLLETDGIKNIYQEHNYFIKWPDGITVSKGAAEKTRYDADKIEKEGLHPAEVYSIIYPVIEKSDYICGHNIIGFDIYMWKALCEKLNAKYYNFIPKAIDTFPIAKGIKLEILPKSHDDFLSWMYKMYHLRQKGLKCSLGALCKEYDIEYNESEAHDALYDLRCNFQLWQKIRYSLKF